MPRPNKCDAAGSAAAVSAAAKTENTRNHQAPGGAPGYTTTTTTTATTTTTTTTRPQGAWALNGVEAFVPWGFALFEEKWNAAIWGQLILGGNHAS